MHHAPPPCRARRLPRGVLYYHGRLTNPMLNELNEMGSILSPESSDQGRNQGVKGVSKPEISGGARSGFGFARSAFWKGPLTLEGTLWVWRDPLWLWRDPLLWRGPLWPWRDPLCLWRGPLPELWPIRNEILVATGSDHNTSYIYVRYIYLKSLRALELATLYIPKKPSCFGARPRSRNRHRHAASPLHPPAAASGCGMVQASQGDLQLVGWQLDAGAPWNKNF